VGLISNTHGMLRPEAIHALTGCDLIVHAGDIGSLAGLRGLEQIAPVRAVRGNLDRHTWSARLPETQVVQVGPQRFYVLHDLLALDLDPSISGFAAVGCGHTHRPELWRSGGVLYFNPGATGPQRGGMPATIGRMVIQGGEIGASHVRMVS
jgi:putative phosphoesterase